MTAAALPKRFSSIPSKFSADGNKRSSTAKPANNPFSFNSYAFKPAPQPTSPHVPVDAAELTRRLERYLASLEPGSDAAAPPAQPTAISKQASSAGAARHPVPCSQQQSNNGANPPFLKLRTESATASAHSLASPNSGAAASLSKKSSTTALDGGAVLLASRTVTEPLPHASAPRSDGDRATLEALRQEARRAARRSLALHAGKSLNAPVAPGELSKRLNALNGGVDPAVSAAVQVRRPPLPGRTNSGGDVRRSSSARANEKRTRTPGVDLRKSSSMRIAEARIAALEYEREKTRVKEAHGNRRSMRRSMPVGADADQLWRIYVSTQRGTNTQAMAQERHQSLRKTASARKAGPVGTLDIDLAGRNGGKALLKSRSTGCVEGTDGALTSGELGKAGEYMVGRRPDWSQRDEMEKLPLHHPLHLHIHGFGRKGSLATEAQTEDEKVVPSDVESKRRSKTPETKTRYRRSVCVADVANQKAPASSETSRRGPPQLPALLHIPSPRSSEDIITLQQASSSSSPFSPATASPPSITLSPIDSSNAIPIHPGFGTTTVNRTKSMGTSSPPKLPALRHSSSFEARIPQHLFHSSPTDNQHQHQSLLLSKAPGRSAPMAPLPEFSALPAPDRFSKKRPSMPPRNKTPSSYSLAAATAAAAAASNNKARGQATATSPVSAAAPSSVPWPGPAASQGRGGRMVVVAVGGGGAGSGVREQGGQAQHHQNPRVAMRGGRRSQSAMEIRVKQANDNNTNTNSGSNGKPALSRRKSVAFASTTISYPAPASYVGVSDADAVVVVGGGGTDGERRSAGAFAVAASPRGIQRSSTLPIKSRDIGDEREKEREGEGQLAAAAKTPTRLVFWRRDSGKVVDEGVMSGGEEQHHMSGMKSPSRLAFWKKGK